MNRWIECVREFHKKFGQSVRDYPVSDLTGKIGSLRIALIAEEARETCGAIAVNDIVETADGLVDLIYVAIGAALSFGIDLGPIFEEVHRTNMLKVGGFTRTDGKILKPEGWQAPRIAELLEAQCNKR